MKVKYLAALAAASVFGVAGLTSCGPAATDAEPEATEDVAPAEDATAPEAADPCATPEAAEPCAAE
ncbi:MAG: Fibronectin-attachment protein (FAP) [Phormidesmis priestleyi Ana]|uniref:Fibronectin-attachment protein (FAP) n=1 Tax=Phormidesmis priestleyi Ana TaxID=1666911 RepID=A0A0P8A0I0_9CYAN|nr:MAG: Fibronectin-attachment protein (FAP) [Phormidesmis priestleyi Ana]